MKREAPSSTDSSESTGDVRLTPSAALSSPPKSPPRRPTSFDSSDFHKDYLLSLCLMKREANGEFSKKEWVAQFDVGVADLPRLMREGFRWSVDNVHPEKGFCCRNDIDAVLLAKGWDMARYYYLANSSEEEAPLWKGRIMVLAKSGAQGRPPFGTAVLSQFRLSELSPDNVCFAQVFNREGRRVYFWGHSFPGEEFNAIYDDMPLDGWWPWPKKQHQAVPGLPSRDRWWPWPKK